MNITKAQYKKALADSKVYIIGTRFTRNGWTEYSLFRIVKNKLQPIDVVSPYHKGFNNYKCVAWGTSRPLEIILSIGYELGLKFTEMRQSAIMLN